MPALFIFPSKPFHQRENPIYISQRYAPKFCPFTVLHFQEKLLKRRNRRETPRVTTPHKAAWLWEMRYLENNCIKLFDCFDSYTGCQSFAARTSAAKQSDSSLVLKYGLCPASPNRQFSPSPEKDDCYIKIHVSKAAFHHAAFFLTPCNSCSAERHIESIA